MRLIKVNAPQGRGADISKIAFSVGINQVSIFQIESRRADGDTFCSVQQTGVCLMKFR